MTTKEQRQAALAELRKAFDQTDRGVCGWLEGIGSAVADNREIFTKALMGEGANGDAPDALEQQAQPLPDAATTSPAQSPKEQK